uniref:hypothetical protein n=1 Tax=Pseudomonas viridiflava TaxID=33069 RepID=UPI001982030F
EDTCLMSRWQPVYRRHELNTGFDMERENLAFDAKGNDKRLAERATHLQIGGAYGALTFCLSASKKTSTHVLAISPASPHSYMQAFIRNIIHWQPLQKVTPFSAL